MKKETVSFLLLLSMLLGVFAPLGLAIGDNAPTEEESNIDEPADANLEENTEGLDEVNREEQIKPLGLDIESDEDNNVYLNISPINETVLSGDKLLFKLTVKFTGSKRTHKNVLLTVDMAIPENYKDYIFFNDSEESLKSLEIDGVAPIFDRDNNQLIYSFDEIERGQTYEKIIQLETTNGYINNNTIIKLEASLTGETHFTENDLAEEPENVEVLYFSLDDDAEAKIEATGTVSIKKIVESPNSGSVLREGDSSSEGEVSDGEVIWRIEVVVPKKNKGQMFLKDSVKIRVEDILPEGIDYVGMVGDDPEPDTISGKTLTWRLDAPTYAEQESETVNLYHTTLSIKTYAPGTTAVNQTLTNEAKGRVEFISGVAYLPSSKASIYISSTDASSTVLDGSVYHPAHYGPLDGNGNVSSVTTNKNPNPTVTDDAYLQFRFNAAALRESNPSTEFLVSPEDQAGWMKLGNEYLDFKEYTILYDIDNNLVFESIRMPASIVFRPTSKHPDNVFFTKSPVFDVIAVIEGENGELTERVLKTIDSEQWGKSYTREELGLSDEEKVNQIKIDFTYAPGGLQSTYFYLYFTVVPEYTGTVENKYNVVGTDGLDQEFDYNARYPAYATNGLATDLSGPRQAQVIDYAANDKLIGEVGVELLDHTGGKVTSGENRMKVSLKNILTSKSPMKEDLETYVLLPAGVRINNTDDANESYSKYDDLSKKATDTAGSYEILDDNYNGSGRQLVKISWPDVSRITKGEELLAELDVTIAEKAPSKLWFDVYGFTGSDNLTVLDYSIDIYTNTVLQTDTDDLNGDGDIQHSRLKSSNLYTLIGNYDIQTEKLVKGPCDAEYSKFTLASPEDLIQYKLKLTNTTGKDIYFMTLIDVLPSIGDLGITDNISRGSQFALNLTGPITIPSAWEDKVLVYYSEATNPERDDLTRNVSYPVGTPESSKLGNPDGAQVPDWTSEADTTTWTTEDWIKVNSFKVELVNDGIENAVWIKGEEIEIDFTMVLPSESELSEEVLDCSAVPQQRAAWNSFAASTEQGQVVEPERVGVAIRCPGSVELKKVDEEGNALTGAEFSLYKEKKKIEIDENGDETEVLVYEAIKIGLEVDENGTLKVEGLGYGNYYFVETKAPEGYLLSNTEIEFTIKSEDYINCQHETVELVKINNKEPLIEKDVEGQAEYEVDRDEVYEYHIKVTMPGDIDKYVKLNVTDTLDDRLEYVYEDTDINSGWQVDGLDKDDIAFTMVGQELKWSIKESGFEKLAAGDELVITFQSKIKPDAGLVLEEAGIPNTAKLEFDNGQGGCSDPGSPPETPPVIVIPEEGGLKVIKVDKDDNSVVLEGAEFKLTKDKAGSDVVDGKGTVIKVNGSVYDGFLENLATGSDGTFMIEGLAPGVYYLHETKAPSYTDENGELINYKLLKRPIEIEIENGVVLEEEVENKNQKWSLPSTGGRGTIIFTLIGVVLLMMTVTYFYKIRRYSS